MEKNTPEGLYPAIEAWCMNVHVGKKTQTMITPGVVLHSIDQPNTSSRSQWLSEERTIANLFLIYYFALIRTLSRGNAAAAYTSSNYVFRWKKCSHFFLVCMSAGSNVRFDHDSTRITAYNNCFFFFASNDVLWYRPQEILYRLSLKCSPKVVENILYPRSDQRIQKVDYPSMERTLTRSPLELKARELSNTTHCFAGIFRQLIEETNHTVWFQMMF